MLCMHRAKISFLQVIAGLFGLAAVLALAACSGAAGPVDVPQTRDRADRAVSVCPPFPLRDEAGQVIDPVKGVNATAPYSPKQTCGAKGCHDYDTITRGFHFQMGRGEAPTADQAARVQWASTPGFYGGTWCSPAPLYNYLSPRENEQAVTMDLTSYSILAKGCGQCHPGGGSAEYDRAGRRYDHWMADPASGFTSGGPNNLDGDYYKARWTESGVLEADCLICHLPAYQFTQRKAQIAEHNFRWAAAAGSGLAQVSGSVKSSVPVTVTYDPKRFDAEGKLSLKMAREPQNKVCLECHAQPGWKKRGANFSPRTDVHLRAGMRCVDCHPAGKSATDPRIHGHEEHQFGKGDDPGGNVRNDLDNTLVSCAGCHDTGRRGAPRAVHKGLPRLHLERLACQTCHIPERTIMPASVQASDVFNSDARIPGTVKRLWTFYGTDATYRNHYGILDMAGYDQKPTEAFRPVYVKYKGKIYPANRLHTAWPAIETEGKPGLMQPKMDDVYRMWTEHRQDPTRFPELARITDDTDDGTLEVNRPEEIDALIAAVTRLLKEIGWPLENSRVVWVQNERVYTSGTEYRSLPKHEYEASPYGNVHTYNHDVYPARAALGAGGCGDCHSAGSPFFFGAVLERPFGPDGQPVWITQSAMLGYTGAAPRYDGPVGAIAAFFEWLTIVVIALLVGHIALESFRRFRSRGRSDEPAAGTPVQRFNDHFRAQHLLLMISVLLLFLSALFLVGLRFSGAAWAAALSGALGGADFWRVVHRIGGALLVFVSVYHLVYSLIHEEGRRDFRLLLPRTDDFRHLWDNLRWFLGASPKPPAFGRFTYFEKFDYWAVFWGCVIMIGTGLGMWFPELVVRVAPGLSPAVFDALKEAHAHEALLAFLAIVIWHLYNVHLRPGRFPLNWLWVHGRADLEELRRERPLDPTVVHPD